MTLTDEQLLRIKIAKLKPMRMRTQEDYAFLQLEKDELEKELKNNYKRL